MRRYLRLSHRLKLRQRHPSGHAIIKDNLHRHANRDVSVVHYHQVGQQTWSFFSLYRATLL